MMRKDLTILLSASGSPSMPGQLECFRRNGERNIRIVGMDMSDEPSARYLVDTFYQVPAASEKCYCDIVLDICKKEGIDIYFPNISAEVSAVALRLGEFEAIGTIVSIADQKAVEITNNKLSAYRFLKTRGIGVPDFYPVYSAKDFVKGCRKLGYPNRPVCLKITEESGSRGVRIIDAARNRYQIFAHEKPNSFFTSYDDMLSILSSTEALDEMMLVEYMSGNEYTVDLLADHGNILYMAGRENVVSMMSIAQESVVSKIDSAYEMCRKIVKALELDGNIGFDFMKDANGNPVLMDINPRITATVSVIAAAGVNLPYLRVKQLLGETLTECQIDYGTRLKRRYGEIYTNSKGELINI
ncbi:ATP-grasp domain-containing protein [Sporofaciens musculi]|jgi:carbamoyl-phosphate synthase large subunit|uniref:ATP-grasp domain-containing protein n=1 Tax=Sporofaciens musculi TaxID=2681861 RepID=UPI002588F0F9|nr:ATP-grasp domain-containing protein [Sporofaciens musculi]